MNTFEIERELRCVGPCIVVALDRLNGLKVGRKKVGVVVNTDKSSGPGEHWVAIFLNGKGKGQFFCSFGLPPLHKELVQFMVSNCPKGWTFNNITIQEIDETICGNLCIAFLKAKFAGMKYTQFIARLK